MPPEVISFPRFDFVIRTAGGEKKRPTLLETTEFLYDLNLIYELARLASDRSYAGFRFSFNAIRRNGRPLRRDDRLTVRRLNQQSPLELELAVLAVLAAGPSIWALVQAVEKI